MGAVMVVGSGGGGDAGAGRVVEVLWLSLPGALPLDCYHDCCRCCLLLLLAPLVCTRWSGRERGGWGQSIISDDDDEGEERDKDRIETERTN